MCLCHYQDHHNSSKHPLIHHSIHLSPTFFPPFLPAMANSTTSSNCTIETKMRSRYYCAIRSFIDSIHHVFINRGYSRQKPIQTINDLRKVLLDDAVVHAFFEFERHTSATSASHPYGVTILLKALGLSKLKDGSGLVRNRDEVDRQVGSRYTEGDHIYVSSSIMLC